MTPPHPVTLFCLPWAGGSAAAYRSWEAALAPRCAVTAVELPGRGRRFAEPLCTSMGEVVNWLVSELTAAMGRGPYALFGHSLGGMLAFQLTHELARRHLPPPVRLFISAARPPHRPRAQLLHLLPDQLLMASLARLNGVPAELLQDEGFRQVLLPVVRADLQIAETSWFGDARPLTVPVTLLGGRHDPLVGPDDLRQWEQYFVGDVARLSFSGDHFYLDACRDELLQALARALASGSPPPGISSSVPSDPRKARQHPR